MVLKMFRLPITLDARNLTTARNVPVGQARVVPVVIVGIDVRIIIGSGTTRP
jgi:hypothetical protein